MYFWLGILSGGPVLLFLLWIAFRVFRIYLVYRRTPEKRWADRVTTLAERAQRQFRAEAEAVRRESVHHEIEDKAFLEKSLEAYLAKIRVDELEAYPGIGPATIARLKESGFRTLAHFQGKRLEIPSLGQKRSADVQKAVAKRIEEARSDFTSNKCPEGAQALRQLIALRASRSKDGARAAARCQVALEVVKELEPLARVARTLTFGAFLFPDPYSLPSPLWLKPDLPDLDKRLQEAGKSVRPAPAVTTQQKPAPDLFQTAIHGTVSARPGKSPKSASTTPAADSKDRPTLLIELTMQLAFAMARADGRIARAEKAVIESYLRDHWANDPILVAKGKAFAVHYESAAIDVAACFEQLALHCSIPERQDLMALAANIADAGGKRTARENDFLDRLAKALDVASPPSIAPSTPAVPAPPPAPEPPPAAVPTREDRLALLEIDVSSPLTADLVRRQFHLLSERYAPEKFATAGPEFLAVAEAKRTAVHAAAVALLEALGEKLEVPSAPASQELRHNPDLDALFDV